MIIRWNFIACKKNIIRIRIADTDDVKDVTCTRQSGITRAVILFLSVIHLITALSYDNIFYDFLSFSSSRNISCSKYVFVQMFKTSNNNYILFLHERK